MPALPGKPIISIPAAGRPMAGAGGQNPDSVKALILPELAMIKQSLAVITTRLDPWGKRFDDLRQDITVRFAEFREDMNIRL